MTGREDGEKKPLSCDISCWIAAVLLSAHCQRGGWLLAAEALAPLVVPFWFWVAADIVL